MKMPATYAELSEDEMEYDGGWLNFLVGIVAIVVGVVANYLADHGIISQDVANGINIACTVVGLATGIGITGGIRTMWTAGSNVGKTLIGAADFLTGTYDATTSAVGVVGSATGVSTPWNVIK